MIKPILKYVSESGAIYIFSVLICVVGAYLMHQGGTTDMDLAKTLIYVVLGGSFVTFGIASLMVQICLYVYFDFYDREKNEQRN